jgi:hypothetical protein
MQHQTQTYPLRVNNMAGKFSAKWFYVGTGTYQVEKGLINKRLVDKVSQRMPDFGDFAKNLANMYEQFDDEGFDVVNVVPIVIGVLKVVKN